MGLTSRGAGADNIRNVTGDATAGIDPGALIDTRPHARDWHFHILNQRTLYGLPRKFNVAFDGGGTIPTLEDTNDIGFQAVEVEDGASVAPGVWFKLVVGGITGHRDLARETDAVVKPGETAEVADAIVRVYIAEGDRTNRTKARLKYVLDRYAAEAGGLNGFLAKVEQRLGRPIARVDAKHIRPRPARAVPMIPENAPFSPEQRAWLNGFFAGLLSSGSQPDTILPPGESAALAATLAPAAAAPGTARLGTIKPCRLASG